MKPGRMLLAVLMPAVLAACGTPPDPDGSPTGSPTGSPSPRQPEMTAAPAATTTGGATATPSVEPTVPPIAADPPPLELELVASGLSAPTNIVGAPDGRLLVTERAGRILAVDPASGEAVSVADLGDRVTQGLSGDDERGLLGLALHPGWPEVARAFVHYTDRNGDTRVVEYRASADRRRALPGSARRWLLARQPYANHNGGQLAFGPDARLWLGLGDGGSGGDPMGNGQDPGTLLGSILRLDVDQPGVARAPDDAPFAAGGGAPEVHLYGLRNPWRFSFDRLTGALWIADVGQNAYEEVNRVDPVADAGGNLGWNVMEASHCYAEADCSSEGFVGPVSEYGRDAGCSITGGHVYRGTAVTDLAGWYLFGDYCAGTVFGIPSDAEALTPPRALLETDLEVSTFGEDAAGELYVADLAGALYRVVGGD